MANALEFFKMSGSGNDFILGDDRLGQWSRPEIGRLAAGLCRRGLSVGADGLILLSTSNRASVRLRIFNSDGRETPMCGNGARCAARFALLTGIVKNPVMKFSTLAGVIEAEVTDGRVKVRLPDPTEIRWFHPLAVDKGAYNVASVNTGVPHVVVRVDDIASANVLEHGRLIRNHPDYAPAGANVNFVEMLRGDTIKIRTYERGVEGETLACGTGATAAALMAHAVDGRPSPVHVVTASGAVLSIHFRKVKGGFTDVHLEGDARVIYQGRFSPEALD